MSTLRSWQGKPLTHQGTTGKVRHSPQLMALPLALHRLQFFMRVRLNQHPPKPLMHDILYSEKVIYVRLDDNTIEWLPARAEKRENSRLPMVVEKNLVSSSHTAGLSGSTYGKMTESAQEKDPQRTYDTAATAVYDIVCTCSVTSCAGNMAVTGNSCTTGAHPERVEFKEFIRFIRLSHDEHGFLFDTYA